MERRSFLQGIFASMPFFGMAKPEITLSSPSKPKMISDLWADYKEEEVIKYLIATLQKHNISYSPAMMEFRRGKWVCMDHPTTIYNFLTISDKDLRNKGHDIFARDFEKLELRVVDSIRNFDLARQKKHGFHSLQAHWDHEDQTSKLNIATELHEEKGEFVVTPGHIISYVRTKGFTIFDGLDERSDHINYEPEWLDKKYLHRVFRVPMLCYTSCEDLLLRIRYLLSLTPNTDRKFLFVSRYDKRFGILTVGDTWFAQALGNNVVGGLLV